VLFEEVALSEFAKVSVQGTTGMAQLSHENQAEGEAGRRAQRRPDATEVHGRVRTSRNGMAPLIAHVVPQFVAGGMENGIVNLLNRIPSSRYRHAIVVLTDASDFKSRIQNPDVEMICLHKRPGKDLPTYWRLFKLLREMRPDVVYTHSMGAMDVQIYAALAGVPVRVHGEHGQASAGMGSKQAIWRRLADKVIHHYTTVSKDLADFLVNTLGTSTSRVTYMYNGVDLDRFHPRNGGERHLGTERLPEGAVVIGTVGRMEPIKDQVTLVNAFIRLLQIRPQLRDRLRLVLVGDGSLRNECIRLLREGGLEKSAWVPGERADIPEILQSLDVFVLPSISEGLSNTILEAMASRLPVVATNVGGTPELIESGRTGWLVPSQDPEAMAEAIAKYVDDPELRRHHADAARHHVETNFAMKVMVEKYLAVCDRVLA
jgi:sugar transferase (PEP-CTERM/EpsH1 system associated)